MLNRTQWNFDTCTSLGITIVGISGTIVVLFLFVFSSEDISTIHRGTIEYNNAQYNTVIHAIHNTSYIIYHYPELLR